MMRRRDEVCLSAFFDKIIHIHPLDTLFFTSDGDEIHCDGENLGVFHQIDWHQTRLKERRKGLHYHRYYFCHGKSFLRVFYANFFCANLFFCHQKIF